MLWATLVNKYIIGYLEHGFLREIINYVHNAQWGWVAFHAFGAH